MTIKPETTAIPSEILQLHIAVLGMTGSGKTGTAKAIVEQTFDAGGRVCILDPIKSDWWGLTASEHGEGLPFHILGGPHGHVPLHAGAGKAIAGVVASGALPHCIIDMRLFKMGEGKQFYIDFCEELERSMKGDVLLVLEEAHEWAPKERSGESGESLAVYHTKRLATAGRSIGVRLLACTQRIAKLHNDLLSSCGTMIAHQVNFPADQKPIIDWFAGNFGKAEAAQVAAELGRLKRGEAFIGSTLNHSLDRRVLPKYRSYDNTATPSAHTKSAKVKVAQIDLGKLKALMGDAVKDAAANDPEALRAEIAKLEKDLKAARGGKDAAPAAVSAAPVIDQAAIDRAVEKALLNHRTRTLSVWRAVRHQLVERKRTLDGELQSVEVEIEHLEQYEQTGDNTTGSERGASRRGVMPAPASLARKTGASAAAIDAAEAARAQHGADTRGPKAGGALSPPAEGITKPQQRILDALREWEWMGHTSPSRRQVAVWSNYTVGTGTFDNRVGELRKAGLLHYPTASTMALSSRGRSATAPLDPGGVSDFVQGVKRHLSAPQWRVLEQLLQRGPMGRTELAERSGYTAGTGTFDNRVGELRALDLITYPSKGIVAPAAWLVA